MSFGLMIGTEYNYGTQQWGARQRNAAGQWTSQLRNLTWSTGIQGGVGGDQELTCEVSLPMWNLLQFGKGDLALLYEGGATDALWGGRIAETERRRGTDGDTVAIRATGMVNYLTQRLLAARLNLSTNAPCMNMPVEHAIRSLGPGKPIASDIEGIAGVNYSLGSGGFDWKAYSINMNALIGQMVAYGSASTPPKAEIFTLHGWSQGRMGRWIQPAFYVTQEPPELSNVVAGSATVAYGTGGTAVITDSAAADAGVIYDNTVMRRTLHFRDKRVRYAARIKLTATSGYGHLMQVTTDSAAPVCGAAAAVNAYFLMACLQVNTGVIQFIYRNDAGTRYYWDPAGSAWTTTATTAYSGTTNTYYVVTYEHNESGPRMSLCDATTGVTLVQTSQVPWATWSTKDTSYLWAGFGDPYTDANTATVTADWFRGWRWASGAIAEMRTIDLTGWDWEMPVYQMDNFSFNNPDEGLLNNVVASYGATPSYTAAAADASSIAYYGQRDYLLSAGETATSTMAERLRDAKLDASSVAIWRGSGMTIKGPIRARGGARLPAWRVRAGDRVKLIGLETVAWSGVAEAIFVVGSTSYNAEDDSLTISPLDMPDSVEMWITRVQQETKKK